jgi:hypothetical protein
MVTMMKLFWFVFIAIILSWKVSNQAFVAFDVLNAIFITRRWFFKQLWNFITAYSGYKWVFSDLTKRNSLILINNETFSDKIFKIFRKVFQQRDVVFHYLNFQLFFSRTIPRYFSMDHFINYYTNWPDVIFDRINVWIQSLRTHVKRWSNIDGLFWICRYPFSESKISNFCDFILNQQIGRFQVSV